MKYKVAQVVLGLPVEGPFDYSLSEALAKKIKIGQRVKVFFGPVPRVGFIVGLAAQSRFKTLKPILALIDETVVLPTQMLTLTKEFAKNYYCSWGEAIEASLPLFLRKGKPVDASVLNLPALNTKQEKEIALLHDPGRTKRWTVIIEQIKKTLAFNRQVILLVPEISFAESAAKIIKESIEADIVILEKKVSANEEAAHWLKVRQGEAKIVVGARSAIFAPVADLGLIVVCDEENPAYKQEQSPFYHVRDVALLRSGLEGASILFVSAAPSAELWKMASGKKIKYTSLPYEPSSTIQTVDMSNFGGRKTSLVSFPVRSQIEKALAQKGKVILFMNKKGFSTLTRCEKCGYTVKCKRCDTNLTYMFSVKKMVCRYCSFTAAAPTVCPQCQSLYIKYKGMGVEKLESEMARLFPQARVGHLDKDTGALPLDRDILITTQAVLKWQDQLSADVVAVLQFDSELNRADFRSAQRAFSLLINLRNMATKKFIVQTHTADNYCLKSFVKLDFKKFYKEELALRRQLDLPPFRCLVSISLRAAKESEVSQQSQDFYQALQKYRSSDDVEVLEPQPEAIAKLRGKYRFGIFLKAKSPLKIRQLIKKALSSFKKKRGIIVSVNVEP